jgi:precorrin-2 dehydrogenase
MKYLPINLAVRDRPVIIVGGGSVAQRKCATLLAAGARVTVIAPQVGPDLQQAVAGGRVRHIPRQYRRGDLAGALLVFAATDRPEVNRAVAAEAAESHMLVEVADAPQSGTFTSPAVFSQGDLLIAVSTAGRAPALAGVIRRQLEARYGPEYAETARLLGRVREKLLTQAANSSYNKQILKELAEQLPVLFAANARVEIDNLLQDRCGPAYSLAALEAAPEDSP